MVRIHHSPLIIVLLGLALAGATALAFSHLAGPPALPRQTSAASFRPTPARLPTAELRRAPFPGPYPAQLLRVVDGDTFEARVRVWFGQEISTLIRIRGIDAPELKARCDQEAVRAAQARDLLQDFLESGVILLHDVAADKYFGRVVASVEIAADSSRDDVAALMVAANLARPYDGHRHETWCATPLATH